MYTLQFEEKLRVWVVCDTKTSMDELKSKGNKSDPPPESERHNNTSLRENSLYGLLLSKRRRYWSLKMDDWYQLYRCTTNCLCYSLRENSLNGLFVKKHRKL